MSSDEEKTLAQRKKQKRKQKHVDEARQAADAEFEEQKRLEEQMKANTRAIEALLGKTPKRQEEEPNSSGMLGLTPVVEAQEENSHIKQQESIGLGRETSPNGMQELRSDRKMIQPDSRIVKQVDFTE